MLAQRHRQLARHRRHQLRVVQRHASRQRGRRRHARIHRRRRRRSPRQRNLLPLHRHGLRHGAAQLRDGREDGGSAHDGQRVQWAGVRQKQGRRCACHLCHRACHMPQHEGAARQTHLGVRTRHHDAVRRGDGRGRARQGGVGQRGRQQALVLRHRTRAHHLAVHQHQRHVVRRQLAPLTPHRGLGSRRHHWRRRLCRLCRSRRARHHHVVRQRHRVRRHHHRARVRRQTLRHRPRRHVRVCHASGKRHRVVNGRPPRSRVASNKVPSRRRTAATATTTVSGNDRRRPTWRRRRRRSSSVAVHVHAHCAAAATMPACRAVGIRVNAQRAQRALTINAATGAAAAATKPAAGGCNARGAAARWRGGGALAGRVRSCRRRCHSCRRPRPRRARRHQTQRGHGARGATRAHALGCHTNGGLRQLAKEEAQEGVARQHGWVTRLHLGRRWLQQRQRRTGAARRRRCRRVSRRQLQHGAGCQLNRRKARPRRCGTTASATGVVNGRLRHGCDHVPAHALPQVLVGIGCHGGHGRQGGGGDGAQRHANDVQQRAGGQPHAVRK